MSASVQHIIAQCELPPPAGSWQKIAERLDGEFDVSDSVVAETINNITLAAPAAAWENISKAIAPGEVKAQEPAKVIRMRRRPLAIAAAVAALVIAGIWFFMQRDAPAIESAAAVEIPAVTTPPSTDRDSDVLPGMAEPQTAIAQLIPRKVRVRNNRTVARQAAYISREQEPNVDPQPEFRTVTPRTPPVVLPNETIAVSAPPIRDAHGRIVMDMSLLTSEAGNYITVTGPNGEQTRISAKFARFLAYMNNNPDDKEQYLDFLFRQSSTWKKRFEEWRTRIMQKGSFSPSSANFFDILELKDLINEQ
jgi:hypothetical protein